jgi:ABC-type transporter Mla subunit MlaD
MSLKPTHELHHRRFGRNLGVALVLGLLIAVIFGLTVVKVTSNGFQFPQTEEQG